MNKSIFFNPFYLFILLTVTFASCTYNSEEDLYPEEPIEDQVSYATDILPILETNCYACHDAINMNGMVNIEGYDNTVVRVEDGSLLGSIRHDEGFVAMPLAAGKLSDTQINRLAKWIEQGYPNN